MKKVILGIVLGITYIIPGLCSTSMAMSLGVYEDLIEIFSSFYKPKILRKHIKFLCGMILGIIISLVIFMKIYNFVPLVFLSCFIGLILSNIVKNKKQSKINIKNILIKIFIIILLLMLNLIGKYRLSIDNDEYTIFSVILTFFSSMLVSVAFILPGISGSMLMFLFGLYDKILKSFQSIFTCSNKFHLLTDWNFLILFVILIGLITGILAFSKIIDKFLKSYQGIFFIVADGFIKGSFLVLFIELIKSINNFYQIVFSVFLMIIGFMIERRFISKLKN